MAAPTDHDSVSELLNDPVVIRLVTVINLASLSILELLEYGFTRRDVSRALAKGVVEFNRPPMPSAPESFSKAEVIQEVLKTGDYYFGLLSSKLRLTKLGIYLLETLEGTSTQQLGVEGTMFQEAENQFNRPTPHL